MREILFRAKAINRGFDKEYRTNYKNGDWVYGLVTTMYDDRFPNLPSNGTEIFEGDIVKTNQYQRSIGTETFTIEFVEGNYYLCYDGCALWTLRSFIEEVEVIGNKYDNPELIS